MKKSMIILGAFTLMLAVPSFAQEKSGTKVKAVKEKPQKVEKIKVERIKTPEEKLIAKPTMEREAEVEPIRKVEPKKQPKIKTVAPVESRKLKATTPRKLEKMDIK